MGILALVLFVLALLVAAHSFGFRRGSRFARKQFSEVNVPVRYEPFASSRPVETPTWLYTDRQLH